MIKVFHLIGTLEGGGGTELGMLATLPQLNRERFRNIVCSITARMPLRPEFESEGIPVYSLNVEKKWDLRAVRRLMRLLKTEQPDIIHSYLFHGNMLGRVVGKMARTPIIVSSERSVDHHSLFGILLNRLTARLVTAVETNSRAGKEFVESRLGFNSTRVFAVHPGVQAVPGRRDDRERIRRELGLESDVPVVGFVGRLHPAKGLSYCVSAFARVVQDLSKAVLLLVGDGAERGRIEELCHKEGIDGSVLFLGHRPDVASLMSAMDVLVLPSLREGFPRIVLEAMARAKPVVASNVGGVPEAVQDGVSGILVPPRDSARLAEGLLKLLSDKHIARQMGLRGKSRFEQYFTVELAAARYERLYQDLVTAGPVRQASRDSRAA